MDSKKTKLKKIQTFALLLLLLCMSQTARAQFYSVRSNALGMVTGNFNVEGSMVLERQWSVHLPVQYNPLTFGGNKKLKHLTVMPGVRYSMNETEGVGWFFGGNAVISRYNMSGILGSDYRYDGMAYGLGVSAGFSIPIRARWNIEFEAGVGGVYYNEEKFFCPTCGSKIADQTGVRFIPTKLAVNLVYQF